MENYEHNTFIEKTPGLQCDLDWLLFLHAVKLLNLTKSYWRTAVPIAIPTSVIMKGSINITAASRTNVDS